MANDGREYEAFVAKLTKSIFDADKFIDGRNIAVEKNKIIEDTCGVRREFDVYWEYEVGGFIYRTVIECKNYASNISIDKIDALIGKAKDIPNLKLAFATTKGYQSGAEKKARSNGIDLLIVREQNESDWQLPDGTPLVNKILINLHVEVAPRILTFSPIADETWIKEHTDIDITKPFTLQDQNDQIFIDDIKAGKTYSLKEIADHLKPLGKRKVGEFQVTEEFEDAFLLNRDLRVKLNAYRVKYVIAPPIEELLEFDYTNELLGVVEYLEKGTKKKIFGNKIVEVPR